MRMTEHAHGLQIGVTLDGAIVLEFAREDGTVLVAATICEPRMAIELCNRILDAVEVVRARPLSLIDVKGRA